MSKVARACSSRHSTAAARPVGLNSLLPCCLLPPVRKLLRDLVSDRDKRTHCRRPIPATPLQKRRMPEFEFRPNPHRRQFGIRNIPGKNGREARVPDDLQATCGFR